MRMRGMILVCLITVGLLPQTLHAADEDKNQQGKLDSLQIETKNGTRSFLVETAATPAELAKGLMFRTQLPEKQGMLFDFGREQEIRMWMKNTRIPLDMIFIRSDGRIKRIERNTEPESLRQISSEGPARAVLEINAGASRKYGIAAGDRVIHRMFSEQTPARKPR